MQLLTFFDISPLSKKVSVIVIGKLMILSLFSTVIILVSSPCDVMEWNVIVALGAHRESESNFICFTSKVSPVQFLREWEIYGRWYHVNYWSIFSWFGSLCDELRAPNRIKMRSDDRIVSNLLWQRRRQWRRKHRFWLHLLTPRDDHL